LAVQTVVGRIAPSSHPALRATFSLREKGTTALSGPLSLGERVGVRATRVE
jgi:hypothetical protein